MFLYHTGQNFLVSEIRFDLLMKMVRGDEPFYTVFLATSSKHVVKGVQLPSLFKKSRVCCDERELIKLLISFIFLPEVNLIIDSNDCKTDDIKARLDTIIIKITLKCSGMHSTMPTLP